MTLPESKHIRYVDDVLFVEGVDARRIAEQFGTPTYVYSWSQIREAYEAVAKAVSFMPCTVAYAMKANSNLSILRKLGELGAGADIVSGGELARALAAGIPAERIVFSGVGKTDAEIEAALRAGVSSIHAESAEEVDAIDAVAARLGKTAPLSLRVNPDVDPKTHPYISTGLRKAKFGIDFDTARGLLPRILGSKHLRFEGLASHIGSQLSSPTPVGESVERVARLALELKAAGAPLETLDAGGGWPMDYGDGESRITDPTGYGEAIRDGLSRAGALDAGLSLVVEPGRSIVGPAGLLLTQVIFNKRHGDKRFIIVDGAMTELLRPALYQAYHHIEPVMRRPGERTKADIVGPVCESGDFLALDRPFPETQRGDVIAVHGAGAYAASMGSNYNSRPRPAEVLVEGGELTEVRRREAPDDLWRNER